MADIVSGQGSGGSSLFSGQAAGAGVPGTAADREAAAARLDLNSDNRTNHHRCRVVFRAHKCMCRTCPSCGPRLGYHLRATLLHVAEGFKHPALLTLTVDREAFDSPEAAHVFVSDQGRIRLLMRKLGLRRWVWVLEFQQLTGTGWPHWHILIDLADAPGGRIDLPIAWKFWRDKWGIGGLDLHVKQNIESARHAVFYLTKYLLKQPHLGYPVWVLDSPRAIRLFQASGSVGALVRPGCSVKQATNAETAADDDQRPKRQRRRRPLADRMAECNQSSFALLEVVDTATGEATYQRIVPIEIPPDHLASLAAFGALHSAVQTERIVYDSGDMHLEALSPYIDVRDKVEASEVLESLRTELQGQDEIRNTYEKIEERRRRIIEDNPFARRQAEEGGSDDIPF